MLILTRYPGETVEITAEAAASITVTVMDVMSNGVVKLGFDGPTHVRFMRDNAIRRRPARYNQPKEQGYEDASQDDPEEVRGDPDDVGNR